MDFVTGIWPLTPAIVAFVIATVVIASFGYRLSRAADTLADATGLGEALTGMLLLGAATSSSGLVVSMAAAIEGDASLAISNSVGGIAAQTAFIVVADLAIAVATSSTAPSLSNVFNTFLVVVLLALVLVAVAMPPWALGWVHPVTPLLLGGYVLGLHVSRAISDRPMWEPTQTNATRRDTPDPEPEATDLPAGRARRLGRRRSGVSVRILPGRPCRCRRRRCEPSRFGRGLSA